MNDTSNASATISNQTGTQKPKKKHGFKIYFAVVLAFILYLVFANQILFAFVKKDTDLSKSNLDIENFKSTAATFAEVEHFSYLGGLEENFRLSGWAYSACETPDSSLKKTVTVVLDGPSGIFEAFSVTSARPDIYEQEGQINPLASGNLGFEAIFSVLPLVNGTYNIHLLVHENDEIYGISENVMSIKIDGNYIYDSALDPLTSSPTGEKSASIRMGIDNFERADATNKNSSINVSGWGINTNNSNAGAATYIKVSNKNETKSVVYPVVLENPRPDLESVYPSTKENNLVGFKGEIQLPKDFGRTGPIAFIWQMGDEVLISELPYERTKNPPAIIKHLKAVPPATTITDFKEHKKIFMAIDSLEKTNKKGVTVYTANGWALNKKSPLKAGKAFLHVEAPNGKTASYPLELTGERTDLIDVHKIPESVLSGFMQDFVLPDELDGVKSISVLFESKDTYLASKDIYLATA